MGRLRLSVDHDITSYDISFISITQDRIKIHRFSRNAIRNTPEYPKVELGIIWLWLCSSVSCADFASSSQSTGYIWSLW